VWDQVRPVSPASMAATMRSCTAYIVLDEYRSGIGKGADEVGSADGFGPGQCDPNEVVEIEDEDRGGTAQRGLVHPGGAVSAEIDTVGRGPQDGAVRRRAAGRGVKAGRVGGRAVALSCDGCGERASIDVAEAQNQRVVRFPPRLDCGCV
jgi:hypothetical protein